MRYLTFLCFAFIVNATTGQAESKLDSYRLCYQRAASMEIIRERSKGISNCLNAALSECREDRSPTTCFHVLEQAADAEARSISVGLHVRYKNILTDNQDFAARLSHDDELLGMRACDDGSPSCDAMSAIVIYRQFLEISHDLGESSGDIK